MTTAPQTDRRETYMQAIRAAGDTAYGNAPFYEAITDAVMAVADAEQTELRRERDLAIAHDRQPYPTAWAYEQACKARNKHQERADAAEALIAGVRATHKPRTERHGSGCVQCGIVWPCPTFKALDVAAETPQPETQAAPRRGDAVDQWLTAQRNKHGWKGSNDRTLFDALDNVLDQYRLHADTGTPLGDHVCEGTTVGDCECLEQPAVVQADGEATP
jgi:hypothetical protein